MQSPLDAAGDIRQVHERGGLMPFLSVCRGPAPALDAVQEILVVGGQVDAAAAFLARLVPRTEYLKTAGVPHHQEPFRAIEGRPVLVTFLHVGRPVALLEDQLPLLAGSAVAGPFEDAVLRVGE